MSRQTKRQKVNEGKVEAGKAYDLMEAITVLKGMEGAKFDETVSLSFNLGVDPRQSDQMIRGTVKLPNGTGKTVRVAVFARGEHAAAAEAAGADFVGAEDLVEKIQGGWLDFDVAVATPDMMRDVGKLGRVLGPRGLMPNPKTGTVTFDVADAIGDIQGGRVEYKLDKEANLHVVVGKASFDAEKLAENARTVIEVVTRARPAACKGTYIRKAVLTSTQRPGVALDVSGFAAVVSA